MNQIDRKKVKLLIHKLGLKYNLSDEDVKRIVESPYEFAHEVIKETDYDSIETEEDLANTKTNFLFKYIGRLFVDYKSIKRKIKRKKSKLDLNGRS